MNRSAEKANGVFTWNPLNWAKGTFILEGNPEPESEPPADEKIPNSKDAAYMKVADAISGDAKLRYKEGQMVEASLVVWKKGKIEAINKKGNPYQIKLLDSDLEVYSPLDDDSCVRKPEESTEDEDIRVPLVS